MSTSAQRRVASGWVAALVLVLSWVGCKSPEPAESLLFVSFDTTRRDHLSLYGYDKPTTPTLDALAEKSVVFDRAVAQFNTTVASHSSMFTGFYPHTHANRRRRGLSDEYRTMAEILAGHGFRTGAFVSGYTLKERISDLQRGFEVYDDTFNHRRDGELTTDLALEWLQTVAPDERYFLFVHYYDAHGPFRRSEYADEFRAPDRGPKITRVPSYQRLKDKDGVLIDDLHDYVARYDGQIRRQDDFLARLLESVDLERTAIVVTSDHGETFAERRPALNFNHGTAVFEEQMAIPLVLYRPAGRPGRSDALVGTVDLLETLVSVLGVEEEGLTTQGLDLERHLAGREIDREFVYSSSHSRRKVYRDTDYDLDADRLIHGLHDERWKLIRYPGQEQDYLELYDLRSDPEEEANVADEHPEELARLLEAMEGWQALATDPAAAPRTESGDLDALKSLGYLGD